MFFHSFSDCLQCLATHFMLIKLRFFFFSNDFGFKKYIYILRNAIILLNNFTTH